MPENLRSVGVLGLDAETHTIGDYEYQVEGNKLHCTNENSDDEAVFKVDSLELWMLLLVKNPTRIQLKLKTGKEYLPFVYEFKDIADRLELVATSQHFPVFVFEESIKFCKNWNMLAVVFFLPQDPLSNLTLSLCHRIRLDYCVNSILLLQNSELVIPVCKTL